MKSAPARAFPLVCAIFAALAGCGSGGDGNDGDTEPNTGGVLTPDVKDVSGTFSLGDADTPAKGFELWFLDHSSSDIRRVALGDDGSFSLPVEDFVENHVYSMHVIKDFVLYGDVDYLPNTTGTQGGFTYGGGYGFSVGHIVLLNDSRGALPPGPNVLSGSLGGSFTLSTAVNGVLGEVAPPGGVTSVAVGSQLVVLEPSTLLNSFYLASSNPSRYAIDLEAFSRVGVNVTTDATTNLARVNVVEAGAWLSASKIQSTDDVSPSSASFWRPSDYQVTAETPRNYRARVLGGAVPDLGTLLGVKMTAADGTQTEVFRASDKVLTMPPAVIAADGAGGAPQTVDYTSTTAKNGLTRPFCQSGDVVLSLKPPLGLDGAVIADGTFDEIVVTLDYYGRTSGKSVALTPTTDQFPAPYNGATSGTTGGYDWSWDASARSLTFTLSATDQAATTHTISVADDLFPAGFGDAGVFYVRLRFYYRKASGAAEGGAAAWFDIHC